MYFASIYNLISEKIKGNKESKEKLDKFINENKVLKHQLETMNLLQTSASIIGEVNKVKELAKQIVASNQTFIKGNKIDKHSMIKANKKLLEYFNINPSLVKSCDLDFAIDMADSRKNNLYLVESYLKEQSKKSLLESKAVKVLTSLRESFDYIKTSKSVSDFQTQSKIVKFLSEGLDKKNQEFINESLKKLDESFKQKDSVSVEKLYDLRLLTETLLKEFQTDDEDKPIKKQSGSKSLVLPDLKYIKQIRIIAPYNWKSPDKLELRFTVPTYPVGAYYADIVESALKIKKKLDRFQRSFVNLFIYQKEKTSFFEPTDTIWDVLMRTNGIKPDVPVNAKISFYVNINKKESHSFDELTKQAYKLLKDFDKFLPILFEDELTNKFQKLAISQKEKEGGGRVRRKRNSNPLKKQNQGQEDKFYDMWVGPKGKPSKIKFDFDKTKSDEFEPSEEDLKNLEK